MNKKKEQDETKPSAELSKKIRSIMEQIKYQAKIQEKIDPSSRTYQVQEPFSLPETEEKDPQ